MGVVWGSGIVRVIQRVREIRLRHIRKQVESPSAVASAACLGVSASSPIAGVRRNFSVDSQHEFAYNWRKK
jgi:hypothetical protein